MNEILTSDQNPVDGESVIRKVVVGVDGSPASVAALREGARFAADRNAALLAVTAWHMPASYGGFPVGWYPDLDAKSTLDAAAEAAFGNELPPSYSQLVVEGLPARVLIDESRGAELLIVGSRGHGGFGGLLLGSVSQACAEYAKCPVLILHGAAAAAPAPRAEHSLAQAGQS
ncbi:universal stress protein [Gryllotalpicola reticulitermitis]|uniref:Universal stress protein n=1 Tax=Gryllotalpicola reticulitermitis TaxID=1184153 RepID=A0ABV8Q3Z8_9MICO